jgi:hypothetical protein
MKNRFKRPSPATIISLVALVMATTGTAVAAVSFATNAGAVDRLSAVSAGASNSAAAGKLVATNRLGASKGHFSAKFLPSFVSGHGGVSTFGISSEVQDNAAGVPVTLTNVPGVGTVTATCSDQAGGAGKEDPSTTIAYTNSSGSPVSFARQVGNGNAQVVVASNGTVTSFTINGSNIFTINLQKLATNLTVHGVVRQDGAGTATGACTFYGQSVRVG